MNTKQASGITECNFCPLTSDDVNLMFTHSKENTESVICIKCVQLCNKIIGDAAAKHFQEKESIDYWEKATQDLELLKDERKKIMTKENS